MPNYPYEEKNCPECGETTEVNIREIDQQCGECGELFTIGVRAFMLTEKLAVRFNRYGLTREDVVIHNPRVVSIPVDVSTHRGSMEDCTPGVLKLLRSEGWRVRTINWEKPAIVAEYNGGDR